MRLSPLDRTGSKNAAHPDCNTTWIDPSHVNGRTNPSHLALDQDRTHSLIDNAALVAYSNRMSLIVVKARALHDPRATTLVSIKG